MTIGEGGIAMTGLAITACWHILLIADRVRRRQEGFMCVDADSVFEELEQGIASGAVQKRLTEENAFLYSVHPTIKDKVIRTSRSGERESGRFDQGHFFKDN